MPGSTEVLAVGRSPTGVQHAKLHEILHRRFHRTSRRSNLELAGYDACFFCLGVTSLGLNQARYRHLTYHITLAAAGPLARLNPA